ncbi:MAG: hypothetical protein P4L22_00635 [Candidatus Babeliales bacterium]|nr:hypothetical protein [Candidatus Babeliales bacterium]
MTKKGGKNTQNFSHFNRSKSVRGHSTSQSVRFVQHPHNDFFVANEHDRNAILYSQHGIYHYKQHLADRKVAMDDHHKTDLTQRIIDKIKNHK